MSWLILPSVVFASLITSWDANILLTLIILMFGLAGTWQLASGRWQLGAFPAPLSYLLLLFVLWAGASSLWSAAPFDTWRAVSLLMMLPLWAWMLASLPITHTKKIFAGVIVIALFWSGVSYAQWAGFMPFAGAQSRPPSLFGNPNTFATLLLPLLLVLQQILISRARELRERHIWIPVVIVFLLMFVPFILTISRIAVAAYALMTIVQIALEWGNLKRRGDLKRTGVWFLILGAIYLIVNIVQDSAIVDRTLMMFHESGMAERFLAWHTTWLAYLQSPVLGHGFGALWVPYAALRHPDDAVFGQFAHSDPLQYLAELGPFGFVLSLSIGACFVIMSVMRLREGFREDNDRLWFIGCSVAILSCVLSSVVTFVFYLPVLVLILAVLLGLWATLYWIDDEPLNYKPRRLFAAVFFVGIMLLGGLHVSSVMTDKAAKALSKFSLKDHLHWNEWASRLSFDLNPNVEMEWIDVLISRATLEKKDAQFADLDKMLERIDRLQPNIAPLWLQKARLSIARGQYTEAEEQFKMAIKLDPTYLPARVMLGRLYREQGRPDSKIKGLYEDGLRWYVLRVNHNVNTLKDVEEKERALPRLLPPNYNPDNKDIDHPLRATEK